MLNKLEMREQYFFSLRSSIPMCKDELPETMLGSFLNVIKVYKKSAFSNIPRDEDGEFRDDIIEYECNVLDNLYGLFLVNIWSFTEQFLTRNKQLFTNLLHERKNENTETIKTITYGNEFKGWFEQNFGTDIKNLSKEATANLVRILCNHFKHDGSLTQIIPKIFDQDYIKNEMSKEQKTIEKDIDILLALSKNKKHPLQYLYETKISKLNKKLQKENRQIPNLKNIISYFKSNRGIFELEDKQQVELLLKYSEKTGYNLSYSDLDIEKMMYDVGAFCEDFHSKIVQKYKTENSTS